MQSSEGSTKAEAGFPTYIDSAAIATVAHHLPVSKQILADVPMLQRFIENLLNYGCLEKLERLLINGVGGSQKISGLLAEASTYVPSIGTAPADKIGETAAYLQNSGWAPDTVVINAMDAFRIFSERDDNGSYVSGGWSVSSGGNIYLLTPVVTAALASGTAIILDSRQTAILDREEVHTSPAYVPRSWGGTSEIGFINSQFVQNVLTVLSELRAGLAIFANRAILKVSI